MENYSNVPYAEGEVLGNGNNSGNTFSIVSMILGIVSLVLLCLGMCCTCASGVSIITGIIGIVFGILGIKKGDSSKGMAIAGLVMSGIGAVIGLGLVALSILSAGCNAALTTSSMFSSPTYYY